MKSIKKFTAGVLALAMVSATMLLASCESGTGPDVKVRSKETEETKETEGTTETSAAVTAAVETEPTETEPPVTVDVRDIDPDDFPKVCTMYSYDSDPGAEEAVRLENLYLSNDTIEKYPMLAEAVSDFTENNDPEHAYELLHTYMGDNEVVRLEEELTVVRCDDQVFSFIVHYNIFSRNRIDGLLADFAEGHSFDVKTGKELGYEDLLSAYGEEVDYIDSVFDVVLDDTVDVDYIVDYNGILISTLVKTGDEESPLKWSVYEEYCDPTDADLFTTSYDFSGTDCVITNFGTLGDFIDFGAHLDTYNQHAEVIDPVSGKKLLVNIDYNKIANTEQLDVTMSVLDYETQELIVSENFKELVANPDPYLFCKDGVYLLALEYSGYDGVHTTSFLKFDAYKQISDAVLHTNGSIYGTPAKIVVPTFCSDNEVRGSICNSTRDLYIQREISLMGDYYYFLKYEIGKDMSMDLVNDPCVVTSFFGEPMVTAMDFVFTDEAQGKQITLAKGTELYINSVYPDLRRIYFEAPDGMILSLTLDKEDGTYINKIDGTPETDIFEQVFYKDGL